MTGSELIAHERLRQIATEGYDPDHDDAHADGELLAAAYCYLLADGPVTTMPPDIAFAVGFTWPWDRADFKPEQYQVRNLVKAGALIAAEIDRLQRVI